MRMICFLTFYFVSVSFQAQAVERFEFYNGVRSLGMGGATVAIVNDETALIDNPAALGKLRDFFLTVADPEISVGENTQRVFGSDTTAFLDPQETLDAVNLQPTYRAHQRAQLFPSFVVTNFGFGIYGKWSTDAYIETAEAATTNFNLYHRHDLAAVIGFNLRLWQGIVKIGFNIRGVNRLEVSRDDLDTTSTNLQLEGATGIGAEGFGIGGDAGLIITAPVAWLPSIAAVYRDIGNTSYTAADGMFVNTSTRVPETTKGTIDVGFSLTPIVGKQSRIVITGELKDVAGVVEETDPDPADNVPIEDDVSRRLHYGVELNIVDVFFLRAGANQGYWTAGMEIAIRNAQIQVAAYGEEVGTVDKPVEDRRFVGKFAWRF